MKLKDTLNMPKTSFDMRANLANKEPIWQKEWVDNDVYNKLMEKNSNKPLYVLHDGPPYANGDIHLGHALNKILKDFVVRYKNASGYKAPMIYGWDTHGLPIENALLKNKNIKRNELTDAQFREKCEQYALKQVENQKEQFSTLGLMTDLSHHYLTLDKEFEKNQIKVFSKMVEKGLMYKGLKPVYWSPTSQSALAEAEIEYQEKISPAIYVKMKLKNSDNSVVIWTTTPWTMPANFGVAVGEEFSYSYLDTNIGNLIIASDLVESFINDVNKKEEVITKYSVIKTVLGSELEGLEIIHPLYNDRITKVMLGHHVSVDSGTGLVHIAPGHGEDDFIIGKKYSIKTISVVDAFGKMNENAINYTGEFYENANKMIGEDLEKNGALIALNFIKHSYPHDWRTKKPVIFRATAQWFCTIAPIKKDILKEVNNIEYQNDWARTRLYNMIDSREEWCISRQRKWGVPIPIFYDEKEEPILDIELINHVGELFGEYGSNIWFEKEAIDLLPMGYSHENSPNGIFTKELDIMDVWFDSGTSNEGVVKTKFGIDQADFCIEGSDQYRGWFNSSLITSFIVNNKSPYKKLGSHGFTLDGKGLKMSKSLKNTIAPKQITATKGSEILRLWVASVDYSSDMKVSDEIINQVTEIYRRFRNTIKFIHGSINCEFNRISLVDISGANKFMLHKLSFTTTEVLKAYENNEFKKVLDLMNNYITIYLSAFYLDFIKDVTYIDNKDSDMRAQILTVLEYHFDILLKLMMPILPHTTYEAYKLAYNKDIQFEQMPSIILEDDNSYVLKYEKFLQIRDDINKALEMKRNDKIIGKSLEAEVTINPSQECKEILDTIDNLDLLFIVSKFNITNEEIEGLILDSGTIVVEKYDHIECMRCRKYFKKEKIDIITLDQVYSLCQKCIGIVNEVKE